MWARTRCCSSVLPSGPSGRSQKECQKERLREPGRKGRSKSSGLWAETELLVKRGSVHAHQHCHKDPADDPEEVPETKKKGRKTDSRKLTARSLVEKEQSDDDRRPLDVLFRKQVDPSALVLRLDVFNLELDRFDFGGSAAGIDFMLSAELVERLESLGVSALFDEPSRGL